MGVEGVPLRRRALRHELRREHLPEHRRVRTPPGLDEVEHHRGLPPLGGGLGAGGAAFGERAVEDQVAHPLRMTSGIGHRHGAALRDPEQGEPLQACCVDDSLEVADQRLERDVLHVPVRHPRGALVVVHQPVAHRQVTQEVAPDDALPVMAEVGQPVRRLDQRRAAAGHRVRQSHAVGRGAEADLLRSAARRGAVSGGATGGDLAHVGREAEASPVHRLDRPLRPAVVADGAAGRLDPARQRRLAHEPVAPHVVEQLDLADDPFPVRDEVGEHVEDLRFEPDALTVTAKLVEVGVELAAVERVDHGSSLVRGAFYNSCEPQPAG